MIYPMAFLKGIGNKSVIDSAFSNAEFGFNVFFPIERLVVRCLEHSRKEFIELSVPSLFGVITI